MFHNLVELIDKLDPTDTFLKLKPATAFAVDTQPHADQPGESTEVGSSGSPMAFPLASALLFHGSGIPGAPTPGRAQCATGHPAPHDGGGWSMEVYPGVPGSNSASFNHSEAARESAACHEAGTGLSMRTFEEWQIDAQELWRRMGQGNPMRAMQRKMGMERDGAQVVVVATGCDLRSSDKGSRSASSVTAESGVTAGTNDIAAVYASDSTGGTASSSSRPNGSEPAGAVPSRGKLIGMEVGTQRARDASDGAGSGSFKDINASNVSNGSGSSKGINASNDSNSHVRWQRPGPAHGRAGTARDLARAVPAVHSRGAATVHAVREPASAAATNGAHGNASNNAVSHQLLDHSGTRRGGRRAHVKHMPLPLGSPPSNFSISGRQVFRDLENAKTVLRVEIECEKEVSAKETKHRKEAPVYSDIMHSSMDPSGCSEGQVSTEVTVQQVLTVLRNKVLSDDKEEPEVTVDVAEVFGKNPVHVLEGMAGTAHVSQTCQSYGMLAVEPAELDTGWDLSVKAGQRAWMLSLLNCKPLLVLIGIRCTEWCAFSRINYRDRPELLESIRNNTRSVFFPLFEKTAVEQSRGGRIFMYENLATSDLWDEPMMTRLMRLPNVQTAIGHMGAYGATDQHGNKIIKAMRFISNSPTLLHAVPKKLTKQEKLDTVRIEGSSTKASQQYTWQWSDQLCHALARLACEYDRGRFTPSLRPPVQAMVSNTVELWHPPQYAPTQEVYFVGINKDEATWDTVLNLTTEVFLDPQSPSSKVVWEGDDIYNMVAKLVPWTLVRVQLAARPKALRRPHDIAFEHRAVVGRWDKDLSIFFRVESMPEVKFPRLRFQEEVKVAVFIYGFAPESVADKETTNPTSVPACRPRKEMLPLHRRSQRMVSLRHPSSLRELHTMKKCGLRESASTMCPPPSGARWLEPTSTWGTLNGESL